MGQKRDAERRALRERWSTGELRGAQQLVIQRLVRGEPLNGLGLGEHDGRIDLRGLHLASSSRLPPIWRVGDSAPSLPPSRRRRVRWSDLDLSFADLREARWFDLDVDACRFDHANLGGLRCWGVTVRRCSFAGVDIRNSQWGPRDQEEFQRSTWSHIDFRRADLRWSLCEADLAHIDFSGAKFTQTSWPWNNLCHLKFGGIVQGLEIGRRHVHEQPADWQLEDVDFTGARLRNVQLIGVNLGVVDVRLPCDDDHWIIDDWPGYLDRVDAAVAELSPGLLRTATEIWVEYSRRDAGPKQSVGFIALHDVRHIAGDELVRLLDAARR